MTIKRLIAYTYNCAKEFIRKKLAVMRRKKIADKSFSIISNNCWGGKVYQRYGLPYTTPTVGCYFFAEDYLKFINNLRNYLREEIEMIAVEESRHYKILKRRGQINCPIGRLKDIEIVFQHYKTKEEAKIKWERRKQRINWENLIIKFSQMNCCLEKHLVEFEDVEFPVKFAFVKSKEFAKTHKDMIYFPGYEECDGVLNDTGKYSSFIDINALISDKVIISRRTGFTK